MQNSRWATATEFAPPSAASPSRAPAAAPPAPQELEASSYPTYDMDPSVDEFAQTRAPDDLFDDDFTPIAEPVVEEVVTPAPAPTAPRERDSIPIRGAGNRGRGPRQRGGIGPRPPRGSPPRTRSTVDTPVATPAGQPLTTEAEEPASPTARAPPTAPTGPAVTTPQTTPAVRGDRTATGGLKKPKLTAAELTAKLEAMSVKNASLLAAHARAEADQANFEAREAQAQQRRKEERMNRQQMMGERERNRLRKLEAVRGREWDMEKKEEDFAAESRGARRGAHGGVAGSRYATTARVEESAEGEALDSRPAGRGDRGRGRGRGAGRGRGKEGPAGAPPKQKQDQAPPTASDFPDLPAASKTAPEATDKVPDKLEFPKKTPAAAKDASTSAPQNAPVAKEAEVKAESRPAPPRKQSSFGMTSTGDKKSWADQVDAMSPI